MNDPINAVGIWFYSQNTNRHLFLMRDDEKHRGHWGLPGGKVENNETLLETIERECREEMGFMPEIIKLIPIEKFTANNEHFIYHTFYCIVKDEFIPHLNHEHVGFAWIDSDIVPKPLHPGFWATLKIDDVFDKITTVKENFRCHNE